MRFIPIRLFGGISPRLCIISYDLRWEENRKQGGYMYYGKEKRSLLITQDSDEVASKASWFTCVVEGSKGLKALWIGPGRIFVQDLIDLEGQR
jgi:hypothetical protein